MGSNLYEGKRKDMIQILKMFQPYPVLYNRLYTGCYVVFGYLAV